MARTLARLRRILTVIVIAGGTTSLSTTHSVNAATNSEPVPLMLVRANDSSTVYVVSTSTYFEPSKPSACDLQVCYLLRRTTNSGASFTILPLPRVTYVKGSMTGNLQELVFANARAGYALLRTGTQSDLYVTLNGASSWHRDFIASDATILHLVATPSEIYAIIAQCSKAKRGIHLTAAS